MEGNVDGWPLGLVNITSQLVAPPPAASRLHRSSSFSSFSSSNLETESTASFFPDQSVSLGRLIGIEPSKKRRVQCENGENVGNERSLHVGLGLPNPKDPSQGICTPLLHNMIQKFGPSRCSVTS